MIEIDAQNRTLGRVASEAAHYLLGKHLVDFDKHSKKETKVKIVNASKTKITPKKMKEKEYAKYSGYPGGLKFESLEKIMREKGIANVYERAIKRMLPANKLRDDMLKNLTVSE